MAGSGEVNCQPFVVHNMHGVLAIAHNGEISNAPALRKMVRILFYTEISNFSINSWLYGYFTVPRLNSELDYVVLKSWGLRFLG